MPGQTKAPGARARRNTDQQRWKFLPAQGRQGPPPALPRKKPGWLADTRKWWATIWSSPMALVWTPADEYGLIRLARLKDDFDRGTAPAAALPAMQQIEDRYGLNPKSRQMMLWQIGVAAQADDAAEGEAAAAAPATRGRLRAIDGGRS